MLCPWRAFSIAAYVASLKYGSGAWILRTLGKAAVHGLERACLLNAIIPVNGFSQRMASVRSDAWREVFHILCQVGAYAPDFGSPLRSQAGWGYATTIGKTKSALPGIRNSSKLQYCLSKPHDLIARTACVARILQIND